MGGALETNNTTYRVDLAQIYCTGLDVPTCQSIVYIRVWGKGPPPPYILSGTVGKLENYSTRSK